MPLTFHLRPAEARDRVAIRVLMQESVYIHQHLDWRHPLDLLGKQPYWLIEDSQPELTAALACLPYPPGFAWINFFAINFLMNPEDAWPLLLEKVLENCPPPGIHTLAALPTQSWFIQLLSDQQFNHTQDVLMLEWMEPLPPDRFPSKHSFIHAMTSEDLGRILELDNHSFARLWQLSEDSIHAAFQDSAYATVWVEEDRYAGYLIAGLTRLGGHISRLAVLEPYRGNGIGYSLVRAALVHFLNTGIPKVTVNTQSDNAASLALYHSLCFNLTGEKVPVFTRQIPSV